MKSIAILNHIRWFAAFEVMISHIRINMLAQPTGPHARLFSHILYEITGCGHAGVVIFFVLSGFLVGGKAVKLYKSPNIAKDWPVFLADRFTRIFLVLWPALLLSAAVLLILHLTVPDAPMLEHAGWGWHGMKPPVDADLNWPVWLGAAVLLNETVVRSLDIDGPLWSLSYEWFYYVAALAGVLLLRRVFSLGPMLVIGYGIALTLLCAIFNTTILLLALVWCMGAAAKLVFDGGWLTSRFAQWGTFVLLGLVFLVYPYRHIGDLLLGVLVAVLVANRNWAHWQWGAGWGEELSSFSYSLYVVHFPIQILVLGELFRVDGTTTAIAFGPKGLLLALATLALVVVVAKLFSLLTEARTATVRDFIMGRPRLNRLSTAESSTSS